MKERTVGERFMLNALARKKKPTAKSEERRVANQITIECSETSEGLEIKVWGLGRKDAENAIVKAIKESAAMDGEEAEKE